MEEGTQPRSAQNEGGRRMEEARRREEYRQEKQTLMPIYPTRRSTKAQMKPGLGPRASTSLPQRGAEA